MKNFLKKRWFLSLLVVMLILLVGWKKSAFSKTENKEIYKVKKKDLQQDLTISGKIDATEKVDLRFQSSGHLTWVGVEEGDYVKKYQPIASLDKRTIQANLKKYLNTYAKTRLDYDQTKEDDDIKNIGGLSEDARRSALRSLEKAQYDLDSSVLNVEIQNISLRYATLVTPIEGIVTQIGTSHSGVNITPSQAKFEIVNPKSIYFSVFADQTDIVSLDEGKEGMLVFDSYPDKEVKGKIESISFAPEKGESGTVYEVKISFDAGVFNPSQIKYHLGMTGDFNLPIKSKKNVLAIPFKYLKKEGRKNYVYQFKDGKKIKKYIILGDEYDNLVVVKSGLKKDDSILFVK